jgi:hypothetical protein
VRQLVEHTNLGQRELALEQALIEQTDLPRVEPVEPANDRDVIVDWMHGSLAAWPINQQLTL